MLFLMIGFSLMSSPFAYAGDAEVKACLKKAMSKENPIYQVAEDLDKAGKYSRYLVLICEGESAKGLYNSIKEQTYPGDWSGKTQGDLKYLGETGGVSLCYHITRDSEGERADRYNCSIRLNISSDVLGKTTLDGMNAFNLNK
jgi:hypothetical protein